MTTVGEYRHTQRAPMCLVLYGAAIAQFAAPWLLNGEVAISWLLVATGSLTLVLATAFHHLSVFDRGDALVVRFGPLPIFQRILPYADIERVERSRTLFLDGWGIHYSIRGGWVWNLWGTDCVLVQLSRGRKLWIGTDDSEGLVQFLESKIGTPIEA